MALTDIYECMGWRRYEEFAIHHSCVGSYGHLCRKVQREITGLAPGSTIIESNLAGFFFAQCMIHNHMRWQDMSGTPIYYFVVYRRGNRKRYVSRRYDKDSVLKEAGCVELIDRMDQ